MTRSTVQKAVVILASKPVFGPIRDRLGVVTLALFEQKSASLLLYLALADVTQGTSLTLIYLSSFSSRFRAHWALGLQRAGFTWVRVFSLFQGSMLMDLTGTSL
jgi:Transport protein Avl9